jgi:dihydroorotate dehydrogenase
LSLYGLARPFLFALDPETAHRFSLKCAAAAKFALPEVPSRPVTVMGMEFRNPVGCAAGIDKNAEHVDTLSAMGFGFVELGGVTPRAQPGNPKPRLFRVVAARAIINRFGLNSEGVEAFADNLSRARARTVIGVNIGKNKDTPNESAVADYERCLEVLYPHVHYLSINVSSPNTKGLRDLQSAVALAALLRRLRERRDELSQRHGRRVALAVKMSPDLEDAGVREFADVVRKERMDAIVATNTTVSRASLEGHPEARQEGGLSGEPLRSRALHVLRTLSTHLQGEVPLIGCGGVMNGSDARSRYEAGASLLQIYTGLVYRGPELIAECVRACPSP